MLSLGCVCYIYSAYLSGVRFWLQDPVPRKVFADAAVKTDMSTQVSCLSFCIPPRWRLTD